MTLALKTLHILFDILLSVIPFWWRSDRNNQIECNTVGWQDQNFIYTRGYFWHNRRGVNNRGGIHTQSAIVLHFVKNNTLIVKVWGLDHNQMVQNKKIGLFEGAWSLVLTCCVALSTEAYIPGLEMKKPISLWLTRRQQERVPERGDKHKRILVTGWSMCNTIHCYTHITQQAASLKIWNPKMYTHTHK